MKSLHRLIGATVFAAALASARWSAEDEGPLLTSRAMLDAPPSLGGRNLRLGSIFSDLFRDPRGPKGEFWAVTDRGPNGEALKDGRKVRTFAYPEFSPSIVRLRVRKAAIEILQTIPLRGKDGSAVSGLPNRSGVDEEPWDCAAASVLRYDPAGLDTEGIVRLRSGEFWLSEEYGPSLMRVTADGVVVERLVPKGSRILTEAYRVREALPAIFGKRVQNRGFESLALSGDGRTLYAILQSPLANPDAAAAKVSRTVRVLRLDALSGVPTGQYVLPLDEAATLGASAQSDIKVSAAIWVAPDRLLIDERTDETARVLAVDLRRATNILGSPWDEVGQPALESVPPTALEATGVIPARTRLVVDLSRVVPNLPAKIEGMAFADSRTLVFGNDNEFAFDGCDAESRVLPVDRPSEMLFVRFQHRVR